MVEQTREPRRAVVASSTSQAGPGDDITGHLLDGNFRRRSRSTQSVGRQLATIGDQLTRNRTQNPRGREVRRPLWGLRIESRAFWVSTLKLGNCGDLTGGALLTAALLLLGWKNRP
ncbi:bcl-2-interacting killer isoform X2 [Vanacampus margaritifer]